MTQYQGNQLRSGGRIQSGVPTKTYDQRFAHANGLNLRGVVVATYLIDDANHPQADENAGVAAVAVYCDVLCYSSMSTMRFQFLPQVLVAQAPGQGMHRGRAWKPRAASIDKTGNEIDYDGLTNPGELDGDHVIISFLDDNLTQPYISGSVPHPSVDVGNEDAPPGNRLCLKAIDGDPDFTKHHGSFYGINDTGDYIVDTRFANDGSLDEAAKEPAPPTDPDDKKGSQRFELPENATFEIAFYGMSDPKNPSETMRIFIKKDLFEIGKEGADDKLVLDSKAQIEFIRLADAVDRLALQLTKGRAPVCEFPFPLLFGDIVECFPQPVIYTPGDIRNARTGNPVTPNNAPMDADAGDGEFLVPGPPPSQGVFDGADSVESTNSDLGTIDS